MPLLNRANGTFTVTTDAEVTDTNGPLQSTPDGHTIIWKVDGALADVPRLQISLSK